MIEFRHVKKNFGNDETIKDLSFKIKKGELFVLVGTSGSGKTTTLKMINQLYVQTDGDILFKGKRIKDYDLRSLRLDIGYVLQQIALFPTMTVAQNIALIPEMKKYPRAEIDKKINDLLKQVELDPEQYRDRYPNELSGGEQQRIGILRAIAAEPPLVLYDEPFSALDPLVRTQLQDLVLKLHESTKSTAVFVTHDMDEALKLGDRIGVMSNGDLLQVDTPENIAQHPANDFVEEFFANTINKNVFDTSIDKLFKTGFYIDDPHSDDVVVLENNTTLTEVFQALSEHQYVQITDNTGKVICWTNRQEVMRFLGERSDVIHENK